MITFYEYPKCSTCQRAKKELKQYVSNFETIDIKTNPPKDELLKTWMNQGDFTLKNFFNTSGNRYKSLGLKDKIDSLTIDQAADMLSKDGMLIKRPLLIKDGTLVQIGARKSYQTLFES
ncbi:spx/MgsR family transcriptional regulator [Streptococcus urinalis FB127-CNA-2]|uniref:Transcriptional regulator, Spx/MgsR family n=1 Tax=Streptococcus urinalis 2285-97 TaxID=764291 RepID=G5KCG9_9STRE|nr:arsenate reductase family protein [Streptococcus urinalis]EHJ56103.1 transcriptional regulator, Spx/MgsR family [Streptococcus urinalis 2285-97]EKS17191.1 spx/MgsR family transcriptional regulator [Streptococcus urinalis FB127-CNA-2]VEF32559.1 ArsC family protein [Streptococcus urinalis]